MVMWMFAWDRTKYINWIHWYWYLRLKLLNNIPPILYKFWFMCMILLLVDKWKLFFIHSQTYCWTMLRNQHRTMSMYNINTFRCLSSTKTCLPHSRDNILTRLQNIICFVLFMTFSFFSSSLQEHIVIFKQLFQINLKTQ